jgi:hypothetical protein
MTRTGKIARLPKAVRDQLNKNLEDGVPGVRLVDWLNSLPEVQQVLMDQFDGRGINESNLSEWKTGGFLDWQARRDMLLHAQELAEEAEDLTAAVPGNLAEHLSVIVAGRYAELLNKWNGDVDEAFMKQLKGLRLLCQDVAVLRRGACRTGHKAENRGTLQKETEGTEANDEAHMEGTGVRPPGEEKAPTTDSQIVARQPTPKNSSSPCRRPAVRAAGPNDGDGNPGILLQKRTEVL